MNPLRPVFLVGSTVFWLIMTSLLIQKEFFQLTPLQSAYQVLPLQDWDLRQEYHAIFLGKQRVGFNWNLLERKDDNLYEFRHSSYLSFLFLGEAREMLIKQTAHLDRQLNILDFEVRISSGKTWTKIEGQAAKGNLNVVIENSESTPVRRIFPVDGPLFFADALDFIWIPENLKPGKQGRIKMWNALAMSAQEISFQVKRKEKISYHGKETEAYLIIMNVGDLPLRTWVSPQGVVLREESSTGLLFEKDEAWKIFDAMRENRASPPDLPNLFSVPSNEILKSPASLSYLKARVITGKEDFVMEMKKPDLKEFENVTFESIEAMKPQLAPYLAADPWVQSDDPAVMQTAKQLTAGETRPLAAALKLNDWVHKNISPVPTVSLPHAGQVLQSKEGDCNEYSVLLAALARAAGIPAKLTAGLVYQNGRFFYHEWVQVFAGKWISLDPTFGQAPADATHIPLSEGGLEEQVALAGKIGKIKVLVMDSSERTGAHS